MQVRFWGARGSLPVSGGRYLRYGGNTTCVELRSSEGKVLIIDAGTGIRELGNLLIDEGIFDYSMLFTHAHWDHILGFPFFLPIYKKQTNIDVFGCSAAQKTVRAMLEGTMATPNFPIDFSTVKERFNFNGQCPCDFKLGSIKISVIPLNHPDGGHGFKFEENGKVFVFLTDNELGHKHPGGPAFDEFLEFSRGADLFVHDAEYWQKEYKLTKGWGHSTVQDAHRLALEAEVKQFGIFHHNVERSDDEVDNMVSWCDDASKGAGSELESFGVVQGSSFIL